MASVTKRGSRWYVNFRDPESHKVRQKAAPVGATKTEAIRIGHELERRGWYQPNGIEMPIADSNMNLAELCEWWLSTWCKPRSLRRERSRLKVHVISRPFGALPLTAVTSDAMERRLKEMEKDGAAEASVEHLRRTLRRVFKRARTSGLWPTSRNPAAEATGRSMQSMRDYDTLSAAEVGVLLSAVPDDWRDLFATAIYTAMRKGELFGLRKADVKLEDGTITVKRSYASPTPKGGRKGTLPIAEPLVPCLAHALSIAKGDLVFPAPDGSMRPEATKVERILGNALKRCGLVAGYDHVCRRCTAKGLGHSSRHGDDAERRCSQCGMRLWPRAIPRPIRFHDLRHTTATLLLRAGIDVHRVQRVLRHRDVTTTTGT